MFISAELLRLLNVATLEGKTTFVHNDIERPAISLRVEYRTKGWEVTVHRGGVIITHAAGMQTDMARVLVRTLIDGILRKGYNETLTELFSDVREMRKLDSSLN